MTANIKQKRATYQEHMAKIQSYLEHYDVTEDGKVYRLKEPGDAKSEREEIGSLDKRSGYISVSTTCGTHDSKWDTNAHRLVALIYVPNPKPDEYNYVNHKNGIKHDNRAENLEWCTQSMNVKHSFDTGLQAIFIGSQNKKAKLTEEQVLSIRCSYIPYKVTYKMLATQHGVDTTLIYQIVNRKAWTHI